MFQNGLQTVLQIAPVLHLESSEHYYCYNFRYLAFFYHIGRM
jgi:hypothetical protein